MMVGEQTRRDRKTTILVSTSHLGLLLSVLGCVTENIPPPGQDNPTKVMHVVLPPSSPGTAQARIGEGVIERDTTRIMPVGGDVRAEPAEIGGLGAEAQLQREHRNAAPGWRAELPEWEPKQERRIREVPEDLPTEILKGGDIRDAAAEFASRIDRVRASEYVRRAPRLRSMQEIRATLERKYKVAKLATRPSGTDTVTGVEIEGDLTPAGVKPSDSIESARAVARAFIEQEGHLFGILDANELRELSASPTGWGATVLFARYIAGIRLQAVWLDFSFDHGGRITRVFGEFPSLPPEFYAAFQRKHLSLDDVFAIAADDCAKYSHRRGQGDFSAEKLREQLRDMPPTLEANATPPYLTWRVLGCGIMTIDAATGEITSNQSAIRYFRPPVKRPH